MADPRADRSEGRRPGGWPVAEPDVTDGPFPPLGAARPVMDATCGRLAPGGHCGKPATWHVIWTSDTENGLCCDGHMDEVIRRWAFYDRHPVGAACTLPDVRLVWSWDDPPGRCVWVVDEETLALALAAEAVASPT